MEKREILQRLQDLLGEIEKGLPDKNSHLIWAQKVESLLNFNVYSKSEFSWKKQMLSGNVSEQTAARILEDMKTKVVLAIEQLKGDIERDGTVEPLKLGSPNADYVHQTRLRELRAISTIVFDLSKLVRLLEELISCNREKNYYAVILLCRTIIDHIPPIFGAKNFNEVANNYGSKSFKESMERLNNSSRKIADQHLHTQIRNSETLPTITQVDFSNDLDVLLSEIVRILKK